ncbi:MAG TPA: MBL fold metallo-hydrolase [Gemmatimonadaceae bacterium]|jgi:glyoxylase-like metal-dependent hydrolase (beta-lactamase superfamily II)
MSAPLPLVQTRTIGKLTVHAIQSGGQKLDGGAMFGVVPKPLWERRIPADDRNRIQLGMRCLLIEHPSGLVLVDTGAGNKEDDKFKQIYGLDNEGADGRTCLEDGLRAVGARPEDVAIVINTHLHFDHAGGNTWRDEAGTIKPSFSNARYFVKRGEYDYATHPNERTGASYFPRNFMPVVAEGMFEFVSREREIVKGIRVIPTPGHTPFHESVLIESGGERAFFLADMLPTHAHLPLPWIMGYDVEPLVTLETKRRILRRAEDEHWLLIFEHDATVPWGYVEHDGKSYRLIND